MTKPNGCFNKNKYDYIISTKTRIFLSFLVTGGYLSVSTHNKHHGLIRKDPEKTCLKEEVGNKKQLCFKPDPKKKLLTVYVF